jgi:hypothetical protein
MAERDPDEAKTWHDLAFKLLDFAEADEKEEA